MPSLADRRRALEKAPNGVRVVHKRNDRTTPNFVGKHLNGSQDGLHLNYRNVIEIWKQIINNFTVTEWQLIWRNKHDTANPLKEGFGDVVTLERAVGVQNSRNAVEKCFGANSLQKS